MSWYRVFMGYEDSDLYEDLQDTLHSECVPAKKALEYVIDNHWSEIRALARDEQSNDWLKRSEPFLELLSRVSRRDKDQLRDVIKLGITENHSSASGEVTESQMFSVATEVCNFLETMSVLPQQRPQANLMSGPYRVQFGPGATSHLLACLDSCPIGDDLGWAKDLVLVTRTFRDILFAIAEPLEPLSDGRKLADPLKLVNEILLASSNHQVVYWQAADKSLNFGRLPDARNTSLTSCLTNWFADYLVNYYPSVNLAVCVECGILFPRQRKDNVYCGKTCQNRVAYKRKKIFGTDALREVSVDSDTTAEIKAGLLFYHYRLGLGVIEEVNYLVNKIVDTFAPETTDTFKVKYLARRAKSVRVRIRFLHGIRTMSHT